MDIYTTSFCLPRSSASSTDLSSSQTFSLDLGARSPQPQARQPTAGHQASQSDGAVPAGSSSAASAADASSAVKSRSASASTESGGAAGTTTDVTSPTSAGGTNGGASPSPADGDAQQQAPGDGADAAKRSSVDFNDTMQRVCVETMAAHQCIVSFTPVEPSSPMLGGSGSGGAAGSGEGAAGASGAAAQADKSGTVYNVHLSGGYQQVMAARGHILRESPFKVRPPLPPSPPTSSCEPDH